MKAKTTTKAYTVVYERDKDGWWVASVAELRGCHTQGRSIAQARTRIREAMEFYDVPATAPLLERFELSRLDEPVRRAREAREAAERAAAASSDETKAAVARLARAGVSLRDAAELLGLSFQRVQQLTK